MDGRFYLLSLIAIFLALALGIVLGVHLPGSEALLISEEFFVSRIERDFVRLNDEMTRLSEQVHLMEKDRGQLEGSLDLVMEFAVEGRLEGVTVGLILSPEMDGDTADHVTDTLTRLFETAGALVDPVAYEAFLEPRRPSDVVAEGTIHLLICLDRDDDHRSVAEEGVVVGVWESGSYIPSTLIQDRSLVRDVGTPVGNLYLVLTVADLARQRELSRAQMEDYAGL